MINSKSLLFHQKFHIHIGEKLKYDPYHMQKLIELAINTPRISSNQ